MIKIENKNSNSIIVSSNYGAIESALSPLSSLVWDYNKIEAVFMPELQQKLEDIPNDNIITPDLTIAGPAIEAIRFSGHIPDLRELYANLLASSMDKATASKAHPAFVEIIKQLSPDEAKLLGFMKPETSYPMIKIRAKNNDGIAFGVILSNYSLLPYQANCNYPDLGPSYLENLSRLGVLELSYTTYVINPANSYDPINNHPEIMNICASIKNTNRNPETLQGSIIFTELGKQFYYACIK